MPQLRIDPSTQTRVRQGVWGVFAIGAALIVLLMADTYNKGAHLRRYGVTVTGVVTGMLNTRGGDRQTGFLQNGSYNVSYAYSVREGLIVRTMTGRQTATGPGAQSLKIGAWVPVRYDPTAPSVSMLQLGGVNERAFLAMLAFLTAMYVTMLGCACLVAARLIAWFS